MFGMFKKILGVPPVETSSAGAAVKANNEPEFLPESRLTAQEIHAAAGNGETWIPWRVDADEQQWFRRVNPEQAALMAAESLRTFEPLSGDVDDDVFNDDDSDFGTHSNDDDNNFDDEP